MRRILVVVYYIELIRTDVWLKCMKFLMKYLVEKNKLCYCLHRWHIEATFLNYCVYFLLLDVVCCYRMQKDKH